MAKKKNITKQHIIAFYMDYVLENSKKPHSVFSFAKAYNFEESLFYNHYGTLGAVESDVFIEFFNNTITVLNKSEEYLEYDSRHKLLSFYYTFFENLTANRSYVLHALSEHKNSLKSIKLLSPLKKVFVNYIEHLNIDLIQTNQDQIDKIQKKGLKESAWIQMLLTLKFWMDDISPSFEKTDVFIEKSVNTTFDLLDIAPLKSLIDFGKFIFKEKIKMP
jgi:hypothetical protein